MISGQIEVEVIDERIAPQELIVGISGDMCYVTYMEGKKMNSEKSWTSWSSNAKDPLIVQNKFAKGFSLGGVNGRWSRQAANADNLKIKHPLFNKCFELSLERFTEIAKRCTIVNGVIQEEMIMDKSRNILFRDEYEALIKKSDAADKAKKQMQEKNSATKVKGTDQIPGKFYKDTKTNNEYVYLGTATVDDKLKYCYIEADKVKSVHKTALIQCGGSWYNTPKEIIRKITYPSICYVSGREFRDKVGYQSSRQTDFYYSDNTHYMRVTSSRITMSASQNTKNIFDEYTKEDWDLVSKCYDLDFSNKKNRWGVYEGEILKGVKAVTHWKEDYENTKEVK
jgi:hypothetical protein